jgi:uroporphyrin-III C-methyltransferase
MYMIRRVQMPPIEYPEFEPRWVWLVGAGPGDPGLLTLHAIHALGHADVIVHDALVDERVLALARPGAERIFAGKRGGRPSPRQPDISARLVALSREGKRVLRLKGGDPFVFGRGGEEALALVRAGVPFRVVPGISAGIGALAYAGIPLTHRETNSAVTLVTGHLAEDSEPGALDWDGLARGAPVLVFYMPLRRLGDITRRLIDAGRGPEEPAALISRAATPHQRVLETTLARAQADSAAAKIEAPALFVVGEVVRLRAGLDWLGALDGRQLVPDPPGIPAEDTGE